jgi:hypothetical protein
VIRPTPPELDVSDGIVSKRADTGESGVVGSVPPDSVGDAGGVLDPPVPSTSGRLPAFPVEEVTPPAVDINEIAEPAEREKSN